MVMPFLARSEEWSNKDGQNQCLTISCSLRDTHFWRRSYMIAFAIAYVVSAQVITLTLIGDSRPQHGRFALAIRPLKYAGSLGLHACSRKHDVP